MTFLPLEIPYNTAHTELDCAVHLFPIYQYDEKGTESIVEKVEVFHGGIDRFIWKDGTLVVDNDATSGPYITTTDKKTGKPVTYNWQRIPLVCFEYTHRELPMLNRVKCLQDALKDQAYDYVQNLEQQFDKAIAQIDTQMRAWYQRFANNNSITFAYTQSYYHTAFEVQRGFGVGWTMQSLNTETIKKVLSRPWTVDGQTFTARCWTDKIKLVETVNQELIRMVATGEAPDKTIANIAKKLNTTKSNAGRVIMTESAYFSSAAQKDCFNDLGVEQYKIIGTLDISTCETCGDMDGRIFKMTEYKEGATAPPFHPWCRCCTAPYFADMEGIGERIAHDVKTGDAYNLTKDTTYKEWKEKQDAAHGTGTIDKERKKSYNIGADSAQYEWYTETLGSNAPKTFADFQAIKYSDDWQPFKAYSRTVKSGELSALADFDLYKSTGLQIDTNLVGKRTSNDLLISGKSYHYIARTIGSVSQKRNGVSIEDALDTLLHPSKVEEVKTNANGKSQCFISDKAAVTINPDTGVLIQTNPLHTKKGAK